MEHCLYKMRSGYVFIFYFLSFKLISRSGCRYANWSPGFSTADCSGVLLMSCLLCLKFYLLNVLNSAWFLSKRIKSFGLDFVVFRWRKFSSLSTFLFWESNSALLIKRLTHPMKRAVFSWVVTASILQISAWKRVRVQSSFNSFAEGNFEHFKCTF